MENEVKTMEIPDIVGKTIISIGGDNQYNDELIFNFADGKTLTFFHDQECCESVGIEDICGDINDLIGTPLLKAYWSTKEPTAEEQRSIYYDDCVLWTFYHFATIKGAVTIRWAGASNGYYGVQVDMRYKDVNGKLIWLK